jgi:hypothetical protein
MAVGIGFIVHGFELDNLEGPLPIAGAFLEEKGPSLILVGEQKPGYNKYRTGDYQHYQTQ